MEVIVLLVIVLPILAGNLYLLVAPVYSSIRKEAAEWGYDPDALFSAAISMQMAAVICVMVVPPSEDPQIIVPAV